MRMEGRMEFLRVFGAPAHVEWTDGEEMFVGWCDGWPDRGLYRSDTAALVLSRFPDGYGGTVDGESLVCTALETCSALVGLRH